MPPPVRASAKKESPKLNARIKVAIFLETTLGILSGVLNWLKSNTAFMIRGISKSKIASMIFNNGPRATLRMLCLIESLTFLIIAKL